MGRPRIFLSCLFILFFSTPSEGKIVFEIEYPQEGKAATAVLREPRVGLALGGWGARGAAHIGVLEVLEEKHVPLGAISGVSFGALVGGLYSCGYSAKDVKDLILSLDWEAMLSGRRERTPLPLEAKKTGDVHLFELSIKGWNVFPPLGLSSGQRFGNFLDMYTTAAGFAARFDFNMLRIPFRTAATDIVSGEAFTISAGSLSRAIQASFAVPVLFSPVDYGGKLLVDGTLSDPLPVGPLKEMGADVIVGVDVSQPPLSKEGINSALDVLVQSLAISVREKVKASRTQADVLIRPRLTPRSLSDFSGLEADVNWGRAAALESMPEIEKALADKRNRAQESPAAFLLSSVRIAGAINVSEPEILRASGLVVGEKVDKGTVMRALSMLYATGYFHKVFARGVTGPGGSISLIIRVEENFLVREVAFEGVRSLSHSDLRAVMETREGKVFNREAFERDKKRFLSLYREKGYSLAEIRRTDIFETRGWVGVIMDEGRIQEVWIEGNEVTQSHVLRDEIEISEGDAFNIRAVGEDIQRLNSLELFDRVGFDLKEGKDGVRLAYRVREKPSLLLGFGIRGDMDEGLVELLNFHWDNVIGFGSRLSLHALTGARQEYRLGYYARRISGSYFGLEPAALFTQRDRALFAGGIRGRQYRERRYGGTIRLTHELGTWGQASVRLFSQQVEIIPLFGTPVPQLFKERLGGIATEFEIDDLDDGTFPTKGKSMRASLLAVGPALGGTRTFAMFNVDFFACMGLAPRHSIGLTGGFGLGSSDVPFYEMYTLGGMSYVPGYRQLIGYEREEFLGRHFFSLGPLYRAKILSIQGSFLKALYGILHAQTGRVWGDYVGDGQGTVHFGAGAGLHLSTLFGPVRLDGGWGESGRWALYFTAGYSF